jgi:hypothetical protein
MNDLLNSVIILYGGLDRGNSFHIAALDLSVGGARRGMKGQTDLFIDFVYEADIHKQRATLRLSGSFSDDIASRTLVQISYFGRDGVRLRHVHTVDVLGSAASAHYIGDDGDDDAILMPRGRRVYPRGADNRKFRGGSRSISVDLPSARREQVVSAVNRFPESSSLAHRRMPLAGPE